MEVTRFKYRSDRLTLGHEVLAEARAVSLRRKCAQQWVEGAPALERWPFLRLDWFGGIRRSVQRKKWTNGWPEIEALFSPVIECLPDEPKRISRFPEGKASCLSSGSLIVRRWIPLSLLQRYRLKACYTNDPDDQDGLTLIRQPWSPAFVQHEGMRTMHCRLDLRNSQVMLCPANASRNGTRILKDGIYSSIRDEATMLYVVTNPSTKRRLILPASEVVANCFTPRGQFLSDVMQGSYIGAQVPANKAIRFDGIRYVFATGRKGANIDAAAAMRNGRYAEAELQAMVERAIRSYRKTQRSVLAAMIPAKEPVDLWGSCLEFEDGDYTVFFMVGCFDIALAPTEDLVQIEGFEVFPEFRAVEI